MRGSASVPWLAPGPMPLAAYGGVYIAASLGWLWLAEGVAPDRYDLAGSLCCLVGAGIILGRPGA